MPPFGTVTVAESGVQTPPSSYSSFSDTVASLNVFGLVSVIFPDMFQFESTASSGFATTV